jgi:hypothetical protein
LIWTLQEDARGLPLQLLLCWDYSESTLFFTTATHRETLMMKRQRVFLMFACCLVVTFTISVVFAKDAAIFEHRDEADAFSAVSGSWELKAAAVPPARVEKTGQTTSYGSRDDGKLRKGVAWPNPRFTDNGDGTVRDNLTGLIWLQNANCIKFWATDETGQNNRDWDSALKAANKLKDGECGLTDGSKAGNWRLPNRNELESLVDVGFYDPAIPNTAGTGKWTQRDSFSDVQSNHYWSSSTGADDTSYAWFVNLYIGRVINAAKTSTVPYVWPVRGPQ